MRKISFWSESWVIHNVSAAVVYVQGNREYNIILNRVGKSFYLYTTIYTSFDLYYKRPEINHTSASRGSYTIKAKENQFIEKTEMDFFLFSNEYLHKLYSYTGTKSNL